MTLQNVVVQKEVATALRKQRPVVALESSVIAQGLPYPHNLEVALQCEEVVRKEGAIPATVAALEGTFRVGVDGVELKRLAKSELPLMKIASRDLSAICAERLSGGTTVSATVEIAARVGIRVFATGGIGGVHRGTSQDVSQDLPVIAKFPVAVVCAGAKSILDLPATLEYLETLGVPVIGVGTSEFPGFYVQRTGLPLEHHVANVESCARWMHYRFDEFKQGGMVFALPPPKAFALSGRSVEMNLRKALKLAKSRGIGGKRVTPFLLEQMVKLSQGKTLQVNKALLVENARFAAQLAVEDSSSRP